MTIELNKDMYIHGIWFCGNNEMDYMGTLFKKKGGSWEFKYRFRYHNDTKVFDSEDKKAWYHIKTKDESLDGILKPIQIIVTLLARHTGEPVEFIELKCQGDDKKVLKVLSSRPWFNMKRVKKEK